MKQVLIGTNLRRSLACTLLVLTPLIQAAPPQAVVGSTLETREIRAQLSPRRYTTLAAEIGAKINRLPLTEGAAFKQGKPWCNLTARCSKPSWPKRRLH